MRLLASEYVTGRTHGGRIDTLGLDENGCPAIIEYKRALNENAINQGLFYLDWLLDHTSEFYVLVMKTYGQAEADKIQCTAPRLVCIAGDFTKYDEHAVGQINRNIELMRYKYYFAFKRIKNLACVVVHPGQENLRVYVKLNPDTITLNAGFTRDVPKVGQFGMGDLEIRISSLTDSSQLFIMT